MAGAAAAGAGGSCVRADEQKPSHAKALGAMIRDEHRRRSVYLIDIPKSFRLSERALRPRYSS